MATEIRILISILLQIKIQMFVLFVHASAKRKGQCACITVAADQFDEVGCAMVCRNLRTWWEDTSHIASDILDFIRLAHNWNFELLIPMNRDWNWQIHLKKSQSQTTTKLWRKCLVDGTAWNSQRLNLLVGRLNTFIYGISGVYLKYAFF